MLKDFLEEEKISYFSCTLFDNSLSPRFSMCTNEDWMNFYNQRYYPEPPVQKYILQRRGGIVWWDKDLYDHHTIDYIVMRNKVCSTSMICTFVTEGTDVVSAVSFGSAIGQSHLIDVIEKRSAKIEEIIGGMFTGNVARNLGTNVG